MIMDYIYKTGDVHRFHFVLGMELKKEIIRIARELDMTTQDTVVYMLETVYPVMAKWHLTGEETDGKPAKVNWNAKMQIKLDVIFFRRLKMLHSQMNVFSLAIVVRRMLELFVKYFRKGGMKLVCGLFFRFERLFHNKCKKTNFFDKRKIQTQLSRLSCNTIEYILSFNYKLQHITTTIKQ